MAQQHLALGIYSAELRASYPPPEGAKSKKKRKERLEHGALTIYYQKSGQRIDLKVFDAQGQMRPEALATFSKSLYSPGAHPTLGENAWIAHHPRLLTMLYYTAHHYGKPVEIISAFRIPRKGSGSNHGKGSRGGSQSPRGQKKGPALVPRRQLRSCRHRVVPKLYVHPPRRSDAPIPLDRQVSVRPAAEKPKTKSGQAAKARHGSYSADSSYRPTVRQGSFSCGQASYRRLS
jgi:hypothetical protein